MANLEQRIALLESARVQTNLKVMTDEELDAHMRTLEAGSPAFYDAVLARVHRHPSFISVVVDDPEYAGGGHGIH
ncbi:MAG: hypothetical protein ABI040_08115 [Rhodoferax sp.]